MSSRSSKKPTESSQDKSEGFSAQEYNESEDVENESFENDENEEEEEEEEEEGDGEEESSEESTEEDIDTLAANPDLIKKITGLSAKNDTTNQVKTLKLKTPQRSIPNKITIQPKNVEEMQNVINQQPTRNTKKTVEVPTQTVEKGDKKKASQASLSELLVRNEGETEEHYKMKVTYANAVKKVYPDAPTGTFVVLGEMGANRALLGLTYPKETNDVLDYIDTEIIKRKL